MISAYQREGVLTLWVVRGRNLPIHPSEDTPLSPSSAGGFGFEYGEEAESLLLTCPVGILQGSGPYTMIMAYGSRKQQFPIIPRK